MHEVDTGHHLEQFTSNMVSGTAAGRRHVDLTWIGLSVGNELGNRLDWHRGVHLDGKGLASNARDRRDVADEIVPILLAAPGRFSMTNCWPSRSDSHCPIKRAMMSVPPAGANPTMMRTGRDG